MITNLLASIFITVTTNWTDVQRITPIVPEGERAYLIYRECFTLQRGTIVTNVMASVEFEGESLNVLLKQRFCPNTIERTIGDLQQIGFRPKPALP